MIRDDMCKSSRHSDYCNREGGFTLLEIAIVLIIIGVFMVPILQLYRSYEERKRFVATQTALAESNNAISTYYVINSSYPCPASLTAIPQNSAEYGVANCVPAVPVGGCDATTGICRVAGVTPGRSVLIGAIPFVTLEMQGINAQDGYGDKIKYMVSEDLVTAAGFSPSIQEVQEVDSGGSVKGTLQGVVFSSGKNKKGAYSAQGGAMLLACSAGTLDAENCDNDNVILNGEYSEGNNANYYDDEFNVQAWLNTEIWSYVPGSSTEIQNNNTGNIGINNSLPTEKLDVVGNVRITSDVYAQQLCRTITLVAGVPTPTDCFSPDMIGGPAGTAISCGSLAMTGIKSGAPTCGTVGVPALANKTCAVPGEYVTGFDSSGNLICSP